MRYLPTCLVFAALLPGPIARAESPGTLSAQYAPQRSVTGALRVGANVAYMSGDADVDLFGTPLAHSPAATERVCLGGSVVLAFTSRWGARIDALYTLRGGSAEQLLGGFGQSTGSYSFRYDLRYVELPILATFTFPYDGEFVPHVFAGPDISFLLSSKVTGEGTYTDQNDELQEYGDTLDLGEDTASVDVAVTAGAGIKLPLARGRLALDVRYALSINKAIARAETVPYQGITLTSKNLRNRTLVLMAGYEF